MILDLIVLFLLLAIVTTIITYLIRAKKRGQTCIGCPYGKQCTKTYNCQKANGK